jgi:hypothetical protein
MAIEKGLYAAPKGIDDMLEGEIMDDDMLGEGLEIEIVDPKRVTFSDGSMEVTLIPDANEADLMGFDDNLAEALDDGELQELAQDLVGLIDADTDSRKDWADTFVKGLDVLGFKYEERTDPWQGACGVYSTVLAEAAIRFQAETMSETFPAAGPVRVKILGEETPETRPKPLRG